MSGYCMYLRKSRADIEAESHGEGETLARHQSILTTLAKRYNYAVTAVYKELVSGENISSRPMMQQLLDEVSNNKWDGVLCVEVERLARGDSVDQGKVARAFKYSNTKIITPNKTYDPLNEFDEEYFEFSLFMSRREYKTINRRMQAGRLASVKEGNYIGSIPPYGYKKIRLDDKKAYTLEPVKEQADIIKLMFDLYINQNMGYSKIATHLNSIGSRPQKIEYWTSSTVKDILANPIYCGKLRWGWRKQQKYIDSGAVKIARPKQTDYQLCDGLHQPIISFDIWEQSQKITANNKHTSNPFDKPITNQYAGLIICDQCGRKMQRRPDKKGGVTIRCPRTGCTSKACAIDEIDNLVKNALKNNYNKLIFKQQTEAKTDNDYISTSKKAVEMAINKAETQQAKICEMLEQEIYTPEMFLQRNQKIVDEINQLKNQLGKLNAKKSEDNLSLEQKIECLSDVISKFDTATPEQLNELLKAVISKIDYHKTTGGRWIATDLKLDIYFLF